MKINLKNINEKWKEYALAGCVCILFFVCLWNIGAIFAAIKAFIGIIKPVIVGFAIAYIINPLACLFERLLFGKTKRKKLGWILSVIIALIIVLMLIVLLVASLVPQIVDSVKSLADNYPSYVEDLRQFAEGTELPFEDILGFSFEDAANSNLMNEIGTIITGNAEAIMTATANVGSAAINWLIGGIFAVYFLMAKDSIVDAFKKLLSLIQSPLKYERTMMVSLKFNTIFSKYIICELIDSLIVGVANYLFMICLSMPNAMFISVIVAVTNLVPTFGPIIGGAIGGFILLLLKPVSVIPFLIFTLCVQSLDGYVIKPKLFGNALNVPGFIILIAIIIFGKAAGILGMLLAIPIAAVLVYIYTEALIPWLELKKDMKAYQKEN